MESHLKESSDIVSLQHSSATAATDLSISAILNNQSNELFVEDDSHLKSIFRYLKNFNYKGDIAFDQKASSAFKIIFKSVVSNGGKTFRDKVLQMSFKYKFWPIFVHVFGERYELLKYEIAKDANRLTDKHTIEFVSRAVDMIRVFATTPRFCTEFIKLNGVLILVKLLQQDTLIESFVTSVRESEQDEQNKKEVQMIEIMVRGSIGCLLSLSKFYASTKTKWPKKELNMMDRMFELSEKLKEIGDCQLAIYLLLAMIADESDTSRREYLRKYVTHDLIEIVGHLCDRLISIEEKVQRIQLELNEANDDTREVCTLTVKKTIWHLIEMLDGIYNLSMNDSIKYDMFNTYRLGQYLKGIVRTGNEVECEHAVRLLWQLCFNDKVAIEVRRDTELIEKIGSFLKGETKTGRKSMSRVCEGVLWQMKHRFDSKTQPPYSSTNRENANQILICIGYRDKEAKQTALMIKKDLEITGVQVSIDSENHETHSLNSCIEYMSNSIESSSCVIICLTESLKQSPYSRAELGYAHQLNKPLVWVKLQEGFRLDGWLAKLAEMHKPVLVDLTNQELQVSISQIKNQLPKRPVEVVETKPPVKPVPENVKDHKIESKPEPIVPINHIESKQQVATEVKREVSPEPVSKPKKEKVIDHTVTLKQEQAVVVSIEDKCPTSNWSERQVEDWIRKKNVHQIIRENVLPCNGKLLNQIFSMLCHAPEFFYNSVAYSRQEKTAASTKDVAHFAFELKQLFRS